MSILNVITYDENGAADKTPLPDLRLSSGIPLTSRRKAAAALTSWENISEM